MPHFNTSRRVTFIRISESEVKRITQRLQFVVVEAARVEQGDLRIVEPA
jgi:hypothetical protein